LNTAHLLLVSLLASATAIASPGVSPASAQRRGEFPPKKDDGSGGGAESLLGVPPFLPPERLELTFAYMASRFSEVLGREVHFRTSATFARYAENVLTEQYDFALIPPLVFVQLDPGSYVPLGRAAGTAYGEFVAVEGSPISQLSDLRGKTVAVAPQDFDVDYLAQYTLLEQGLDPKKDLTLRYFEAPFSCL
jgi:ABC-type phosphate/phosphonate transport system substrate-binding protein